MNPESGRSGRLSRSTRRWLIAIFVIFDIALAVFMIAFLLRV